jgi:hypothetical protein
MKNGPAGAGNRFARFPPSGLVLKVNRQRAIASSHFNSEALEDV